MLTFDDPTHVYRWEGNKVPSVTGFLEPIHSFAGVPPDILRAAQERGTYVHQLTELYDLGDLDEVALGGVAGGIYLGYLRAWKSFLEDYEPNWDEIEVMGYSQRYGFAGTWDRHGTLARKRPGPFLIDIKTAWMCSRAWGVQTAAYRQIRAERDPMAALDNRATVQLHADGTYDFLEWFDPDDWACFHSLLTIRNWSNKK